MAPMKYGNRSVCDKVRCTRADHKAYNRKNASNPIPLNNPQSIFVNYLTDTSSNNSTNSTDTTSSKIDQLIDLGFDESQAKEMIEQLNIKEKKQLELEQSKQLEQSVKQQQAISELPRFCKESSDFVKLLKSKFDTDDDYEKFLLTSMYKNITGACNMLHKAYYSEINGKTYYPFKIQGKKITFLDWQGNESNDAILFYDKIRWSLISVMYPFKDRIIQTYINKLNQYAKLDNPNGICNKPETEIVHDNNEPIIVITKYNDFAETEYKPESDPGYVNATALIDNLFYYRGINPYTGETIKDNTKVVDKTILTILQRFNEMYVL